MNSIPRQLLLQAVLILLNAFFAASEIAVLSLSPNKLRRMAEEGNKGAPRLLKLVEEPAGFLSTIQIGITMAGYLGSAFAAENFSDYIVAWIYDGLKFQSMSPAALNSISIVLITIILGYFTLVLGEQVASLKTVFSALFGNGEGGQTFVVRELRLPRATLGLLAGLAFGLAGITFQTMLRNPLAAPDIIGITSGASTFAVFAIIVLGLTDLWVSGFALAGGLITALAILGLSHGAGFAGFRMILIGIGFGAMFNAVTQWGAWADRQVIVSGSPEMLRATVRGLVDAGTPRENISFDRP